MTFKKIIEINSLEESVREDPDKVEIIKQENLDHVVKVLEKENAKLEGNSIIAAGSGVISGLLGAFDGLMIYLERSNIGYTLTKFVDKIYSLPYSDQTQKLVQDSQYNEGKGTLIFVSVVAAAAIAAGIMAYVNARKSSRTEQIFYEDLNKAVEHYVNGNIPRKDSIKTIELKGRILSDLPGFIKDMNGKGAGVYVHKNEKNEYVVTLSSPISFNKNEKDSFFDSVLNKYE